MNRKAKEFIIGSAEEVVNQDIECYESDTADHPVGEMKKMRLGKNEVNVREE